MKIIVDADACPKVALTICKQVALKNDCELWTVASFNHQIESRHHVVVSNDSQAADIRIINLSAKGDIIITQDWGLAAMVLGKGAYALSPGGKVFRAETIDFLLEEREVKSKIRRSGGRTKGPCKRTAKDDQRFFVRLQMIIDEIKKPKHS